MKPSAGGQEEDPARISSHSMQKGPNSTDIEVFNQELQNQINQGIDERHEDELMRTSKRSIEVNQLDENHVEEPAVGPSAEQHQAADEYNSVETEQLDRSRPNGEDAQRSNEQFNSV